MDNSVDNPVDKIKRRWRNASKKKRILFIVAVVVVVAVAVYFWRRRATTSLSGTPQAAGFGLEFQATHTGATPGKGGINKTTDIDEQGMRALLGLSASDPINGAALHDWQAAHDGLLDVDGKFGPMTRTIGRMHYWPCEYLVPFSDSEGQVTAAPTIHWESGAKGYNSQNRDMEFKCRWPSNLACIKRRHYGLSWGINQAVQHAGSLGRVLQRIWELDPAGMNAATDGHAQELVRVTNAPWDGETWTTDANGENWNPRVQPVAGAVLWESPWSERFGELAKLPKAQQAQWEVMRERYLMPAVGIAKEYGFSDRASYAVIFDSTNHLGRAGTRKLMRRAFPSGRSSGGDRGDIWKFINAYRHSDPAREKKVKNRRIAIMRKTHPGVCYA